MAHHHRLSIEPVANGGVADLAQYLGQLGYLVVHRSPIRPAVKVLDARRTYGHVELLVIPVQGTGEAWCRLGKTVFLGKAGR